MGFDPSKVAVPPTRPHSVFVQVRLAVHGRLEDGQLHGVPAEGPVVVQREISRDNAAIARQLLHELAARANEILEAL